MKKPIKKHRKKRASQLVENKGNANHSKQDNLKTISAKQIQEVLVTKKTGNIILNVLFYLFFSLTIILAVSFINHQIKLNEEQTLITPIGGKVSVNSHFMNVYSQGSGEIPLVFLSGSGTCSPVLDFKAITSELSDQYKTVIVERSGYGFSNISGSSRDVDTVLEETRSALQAFGVNGPYVLYAHSMSGIEAIYWAQKYPDEVTAIIGLDCNVPESYDDYSVPSNFSLFMLQLGARCGITRFIPSICNQSAAITSGYLTEKEALLYKALFYKTTLTSDMIEEIKTVKSNAETVKENGVPTETPMYFFISDGSDVGIDNWRETIETYVLNITNHKVMELNCGHYVHNCEPKLIAEESSSFINKLLS